VAFVGADDRSTSLDGVGVLGGSMRFAELTNANLANCSFAAKEQDSDRLPMRNMQIVDCEFTGSLQFTRCSLDGATIGAQERARITPDALSFTDCDLKGAEVTAMHFGLKPLTFDGGTARGAVFLDVTFDEGASSPSGLLFQDVDLTGAVFISCELRHASFVGVERERDGENKVTKTPTATLVIKNGENPSVLSDVEFSNLDMENFSFVDCDIAGPVSFSACELAGGTIAGGVDDESRRAVGGDLTFRDDCDLSALEFNSLDFETSRFIARDSRAASTYFEDVNFQPVSEGEPPRAEFTRCDMP
jgi:uncharacterized protein YjbI with pentapeptide repeats